MIVVNKKMTDEERTQVLSKRVLEIPEWDEVRNPVIVKEPDKTIVQMLRQQARELGLVGKDFPLEGLDLPARFSMNTVKESINLTYKNQGNLYDLSKLFTIMDDVMAGAVLIDDEENRHSTEKYARLVGVKHYLSAFHDGVLIYPVKISAAIWNNVKNGMVKLTVTINDVPITDIKKKGANHGEPGMNPENHATVTSPSFTISVPRFVSFFNNKQDILIKNLPDGLLSPEQKRIKEKVNGHDLKQEEKYRKS